MRRRSPSADVNRDQEKVKRNALAAADNHRACGRSRHRRHLPRLSHGRNDARDSDGAARDGAARDGATDTYALSTTTRRPGELDGFYEGRTEALKAYRAFLARGNLSAEQEPTHPLARSNLPSSRRSSGART